MAQYQRQQRTLDLLRRRHSQNSQLNSTDHASSTTASSPRASSSKEFSKDSKKSSKRSLEEVNTGDKETPVQSPSGKRGRPAKNVTPSSATSDVVASVEASTKGNKNGASKGGRCTGKKLSKSARRWFKVHSFILPVNCVLVCCKSFPNDRIVKDLLIYAHRLSILLVLIGSRSLAPSVELVMVI